MTRDQKTNAKQTNKRRGIFISTTSQLPLNKGFFVCRYILTMIIISRRVTPTSPKDLLLPSIVWRNFETSASYYYYPLLLAISFYSCVISERFMLLGHVLTGGRPLTSLRTVISRQLFASSTITLTFVSCSVIIEKLISYNRVPNNHGCLKFYL